MPTQARLNAFARRMRQAFKTRENAKKAGAMPAGIASTGDFSFKRLKGTGGDSGPLLLATRGDDGARFLVKHAFTDCACNDFIYTHLARAMGYAMPEAMLIALSPGEKRRCFGTEYIVGERWLSVADPMPRYETIKARAANWRQFFSFRALYAMLCESDGLELLLADDGLVYRVDVTASFPVSNFTLDCLGVDGDGRGDSPHRAAVAMLEGANLDALCSFSSCDLFRDHSREIDAEAWRQPFFEPFARIQEIPWADIDGWLDALCWIYPDCLGDFYRRCIARAREKAARYLKENGAMTA